MGGKLLLERVPRRPSVTVTRRDMSLSLSLSLSLIVNFGAWEGTMIPRFSAPHQPPH